MTVEDRLRKYCQEIIRAENEYTKAFSDEAREERQRRLPECEFVARLRARFRDLDTIMSAQGKSSERDLVSDRHSFELEVKYFANAVPQGGNVPISDWNWLVGDEARTPTRKGYARYWWLLLPRAGLGYGSKGPGHSATRASGRWNFQDCLSFTPKLDRNRGCNYLPFLPVAKLEVPAGRNGQALAPVLRFRDSIVPRSIIRAKRHGGVVVRADVMGDHTRDTIWGVFYAQIPEDAVSRMRGYEVLSPP